MNKKIESDNSNFTGVRLDTTHAPFAKDAKMSKHIKDDKQEKYHSLTDESKPERRVTKPHTSKPSVIIVN
jgi:hypothetical protein